MVNDTGTKIPHQIRMVRFYVIFTRRFISHGDLNADDGYRTVKLSLLSEKMEGALFEE